MKKASRVTGLFRCVWRVNCVCGGNKSVPVFRRIGKTLTSPKSMTLTPSIQRGQICPLLSSYSYSYIVVKHSLIRLLFRRRSKEKSTVFDTTIPLRKKAGNSLILENSVGTRNLK